MLAENKNATAILADLRQPATVLGRDDTLRLLDFRKPVAALLFAVLHFLADDDSPGDIVASFREMLSLGSSLVISHATDDHYPEELAQAVELYHNTRNRLTPRTHDQVVQLFAGFDLAPPGVVLAPLWQPDPAEFIDPPRSLCYGGVGFKTI
ncbi:S-adenosyl methyltransferase [Actinocrispum wychmicini]|uniref:S-adenosyl methyltransferase n=1 Tax=Actinocrispum wychmicini TaxID=1213861 RepID=A0A4V2S904_9PSEU|nr:S-adenosyl methyltransferase [Actinocrispum wychmicini]